MRTFVADGQSSVRFALRVLLERQSGFQVVGEVGTLAELLNQISTAKPELILLDWDLEGLDQPRLIQSIREDYPELKIIALSGRPEARRQTQTAGVDAFVNKIDPPERLLEVIRLLAGEGGRSEVRFDDKDRGLNKVKG